MMSGGKSRENTTVGERAIELFCPAYPVPRPEVIEAVAGLKNDAVDRWMDRQKKLEEKLRKCRE